MKPNNRIPLSFISLFPNAWTSGSFLHMRSYSQHRRSLRSLVIVGAGRITGFLRLNRKVMTVGSWRCHQFSILIGLYVTCNSYRSIDQGFIIFLISIISQLLIDGFLAMHVNSHVMLALDGVHVL